MHAGTVELRQAFEVNLLERFGDMELSAAQPQGERLLFAPRDVVTDEQRQELGEGKVALHSLMIARFGRVWVAAES